MIDELADHLSTPASRSTLDERLRHLTGREREVTTELARGRSNREIGQQLHMSEATVKVHVGGASSPSSACELSLAATPGALRDPPTPGRPPRARYRQPP